MERFWAVIIFLSLLAVIMIGIEAKILFCAVFVFLEYQTIKYTKELSIVCSKHGEDRVRKETFELVLAISKLICFVMVSGLYSYLERK